MPPTRTGFAVDRRAAPPYVGVRGAKTGPAAKPDLLSQIQKGKKLNKTAVVDDRSAPLINSNRGE